ncbi:MAG TPA: CocE/NonD family hydrolase [Solirubrobacter sp.]|nr:CocE/NonD family hydrolase [Solirubrobacter sp.]
MEFGKRLAKASALTATVALATIVGTANANPLPPNAEAAAPGAMSAAAPAPDGAVPTFVNGMAQNVFSSSSADWISGEVWVESDFDSDGDGKPDRLHADYTLPKETSTDGLKVPVIFEDSPYYGGTASRYSNWVVDHELGAQPPDRPFAAFFNGTNTSPTISSIYESTWLPRGFAVVHSESPGSGYSDGCPSSGGRNETLGATAIIDWLNGRKKAYTTRTGDVEAAPVNWHNGHTAMMGTSYNGTLPIAAATTGVRGLDAIVPISAISDWYDYYRANGMVRAPHSRAGGTGSNSYDGEDLDVLIDDVYSRRDENAAGIRTICRPEITDTGIQEDRLTGNRNAFWQERNYMKDVQNVHAAVLLAHGNNDFNVMTKNAAQFYAALKAQNVPHEFYFHQGGHGGSPPDAMINRWFTKYLWGQDNGVQNLPKSWVVREAATCPPRQTTVAGDQSNTATLTVASTAPFMVGQSLTVTQTAASGTTSTVARTITDIPDATHLVLASAVATTAGSKVADGSTAELLCNTSNPTPYAEWPDPASAPVTQSLLPGGATRGGLSFAAGSGTETLTDDASIEDTTLRDAASSPNRLIYQTNPLTQDVRISGTPKVTLKVAFSKPKANLSAALISYPPSGAGTILTRGWVDPENRNSDFVSDPITPGTFYDVSFDMQAKDAIVPAGRRLALMVFSSDRQYTIRPAAGTEVSLDLAGSSFTIPIVGGAKTLATATGGDLQELPVGGTVPATLALTLGAPASFGAFTPGVAKPYTASTTATVTSTAGDATLTVSDPSSDHPGHLVNGAFALPQPLQGLGAVKTYDGPVTNDAATITFTQQIGANDALRTGSYSKTLTFTLSTTTP